MVHTVNKVNYIDIKEFRELGYLQEVNRLFLHPLGLALEVVVDSETGECKLGGVWDYRDDPDGIVFGNDDGSYDLEWLARAQAKEHFILDELMKRSVARNAMLGDKAIDTVIQGLF